MKIRFVELSKLDNTQRKELTQRPSVGLRDLIPKITPIIEDVRKRGDSALVDYALKFDGALMSPEDFRVGKDRLNDALKKIPSELRVAIQASITNITKYHEFQKEPEIREIEIMPGIIAGEKTIPLNSAGLYVPRGKGSFPSMMMMSAVPAKVAGVKRIVATSPPDKRGMPDQATMAAAAMIGVDEFYAIGGVQAIAALGLRD